MGGRWGRWVCVVVGQASTEIPRTTLFHLKEILGVSYTSPVKCIIFLKSEQINTADPQTTQF